jgi:hypothetical protein
MNATLVKDDTYPGMWRVRYADGALSDMYNLSRAKALLRRENGK